MSRPMSDERKEFLADIITTAVEGGIGYWAECSGYHWTDPTVHKGTEHFAEVTVIETGEEEGEETVTKKITMQVISKALADIEKDENISVELRKLLIGANRTNDGIDIDATLADIVVQYACFKDIKYG